MSDLDLLKRERAAAIDAMRAHADLRLRTAALFREIASIRYMYNFDWLGLPIIQFPQDIIATQEVIWKVRPDAIVETGVARGGSVIFSASMLQLLGGDGIVVGVDVDIRPQNRAAITSHPLADRVRLMEGSSVDASTFDAVRAHIGDRRRVMVLLDSNHTHEHVLEELRLYSGLVGKDSYIIVFDTVIDFMPAEDFPDRPWGPGNNPRTAVHAFLQESARFELDRDMSDKLLLSCCPDGFLRCTADRQ